MPIIDASEVQFSEVKPFDMLVFAKHYKNQDAPTELAIILRDVTSDTAVLAMSDMEMYHGLEINGAIQLAQEQTLYRDTSILAPTKFLVSLNAKYTWLHDMPVWATQECEEFLAGL